jgi:hypothetical protein
MSMDYNDPQVRLDELYYHLTNALDKNDALQAEVDELRVQNVMLRRQLAVADWNADFIEWVER